MEKRPIISLSIALGIATTTVAIIFIARGYVVNLSQKKIEKTGMILAQSTPKGAKIYLDGKLVETTDTVLSSLPPKTYRVKIEKEGFSPWEKDIPVLEELITEIDALLLPTSPHLTPLTNSGISLLAPSPQKDQIAYTTRNGKTPGLWVLDLTHPTVLNLIQENPRLIAGDTKKHTFSLAEKVVWSPKEDTLLITLNPRGHVFLNIHDNLPKETTSSAQPTLSLWEKTTQTQKTKWAAKLEIPEELSEIATAPTTQWSPNKERFLFTRTRDGYKEWHVFNGEKPLGVGKQREYISLKFKKDSPVHVSWHRTNNHLIVENGGVISIVEIDGSNSTEVYSGNLADPHVLPTPDGSNLIILTSFKQNGDPNLYAIGLR